MRVVLNILGRKKQINSFVNIISEKNGKYKEKVTYVVLFIEFAFSVKQGKSGVRSGEEKKKSIGKKREKQKKLTISVNKGKKRMRTGKEKNVLGVDFVFKQNSLFRRMCEVCLICLVKSLG